MNKIIAIDGVLCNYFDINLTKYKFAPYERHEIDIYDKIIII